MRMKRIILVVLMSAFNLALFAQDKAGTMPAWSPGSNEAVLLRYKMTPGQKVNMDITMGITMKISGAGTNMEIPMTMAMQSYYTVKNVSAEGNALVELYFTHISVSALNSLTGENITMDSNNPEDLKKKDFKTFRYMLNVPILAKITPQGQLLETDTNPLAKALKDAGEIALLGEVTKQFNDTMGSSFIQLPEKSVKVGDVWDAGVLSQSNPLLGNINAKIKYRIAGVRGDNKQAVFEPLVDFSMDKGNAGMMTLKNNSMKGWILFDVEKGNVVKSYGDISIEFEITQGKQSSSLIMNMTTSFKTDL